MNFRLQQELTPQFKEYIYFLVHQQNVVKKIESNLKKVKSYSYKR